jgi:vacuolar iron transporter family protein
MAASASSAGPKEGPEVESGATTSDDEKHEQALRTEHLGKHRQYWRDIILGLNDGMVSTFLLVAGVAGSGLSSTNILLTAISGSLAGAVSMAAGEFVATKSQNQVLQGMLRLDTMFSLATRCFIPSLSERN